MSKHSKWQGELSPKMLRKRVKRDRKKALRLLELRNSDKAVVLIHEGDYLVPVWSV